MGGEGNPERRGNPLAGHSLGNAALSLGAGTETVSVSICIGGSPARAGPRDTTAAIMHLGINTYQYANQHLGWTLNLGSVVLNLGSVVLSGNDNRLLQAVLGSGASVPKRRLKDHWWPLLLRAQGEPPWPGQGCSREPLGLCAVSEAGTRKNSAQLSAS